MSDFTIGLALSGGGHKGIAHAGVLQFLEEKGIFPKILAGTSAGSIVAALYAKGKTPQQILELFQSVTFFSWQVFTTRKAGLFDIDRLEIYLDKEFGEMKIGDLETEIFISATEMERGRLKIFNKDTLLKRAILASCAFPGVFSPVIINNRVYCDGGLLNNYPVNILQGRCDYLIGCNVNSVDDLSPQKFNSIKSITLRSFEIMMMHNAHLYRNLCDWHIEPKKLSTYYTFETSKKRMQEIFTIGYLEAKNTFVELNPKYF